MRGRVTELGVVDAAIGAVLGGGGSLLVIEGPPGIGKSRLIEEVGIRAARVGGRPLSGIAHEDQQVVPFAPLFDALMGTTPALCDTAELRRLSTTADVRYWVGHDLRDALVAAASTVPLCISIDDLHWADVGTVAALRMLIDGLANARVLWTLSMRTAGGSAAVRDAIGHLVARHGQSAHCLQLSSLDAEDVALIARDALGVNADESLLRLVTMAHGNPFLVLELLSGLIEENRLSVSDGVARAIGSNLPQRLTDTMRRRLDRLSPTARHAVQVASILPDEFSPTLLARVLSARPSRIVADVGEAIQADLLIESQDQLRFRHGLVRRATLQTVPYVLRRAIEREVATVMLEMGASPEEVATRLARSADIGDLAAVSALREAAQMLSRSDPSGAADLSRRALELLRPGDGVRSPVAAETVALLNQASRYAEAQHLATATLAGHLPPDEEANIRLSMSITSSCWPGERAEENRRALQLIGISGEIRSRHLGWFAYNTMLNGQAEPAGRAAREALKAVETADDLQARLLAEITIANVECAEGQEIRAQRRTAAVESLFSAPDAGAAGAVAMASHANLLVSMGRLTAASAVISFGLDQVRRGRNFAGEESLLLVQALLEYASGRLTTARETVGSLLSEDERLRAELSGGRIGLMLMSAVAARTDDRSLLRLTGMATRSALVGGPAVRREAILAIAHAAWQRGDHTEAARWLEEDFDLLAPPVWAVDLDHVVLAARAARTSSGTSLRQRVRATAESLARDAGEHTLFGGGGPACPWPGGTGSGCSRGRGAGTSAFGSTAVACRCG